MFSKGSGLQELVNLKDWQKIQDSFSEVLELSLVTVSLDAKLLTRVSRPNRLCSEIIPKIPSPSSCYANCILLKENKQKPIDLTGQTRLQCSFDLNLFLAPITAVGDQAIAYMLIGPVFLNRRKEPAEYIKEAKSLGIELEALMDVLIDINVFSYNKICSVIAMVRDNFSHIARTGYQKKRLG
ncbi:MAG: PocR ligand-binding domain-containing protein, partial [Omnitrophica bacterium]|nr:PocR ligand-binding domain-containing protein [Candidatus Omnitrophota bacterium]